MFLTKKHILLIGNTGSGKSSTLNALAQKKIAKVGFGVDPQTQKVLGFFVRPFIIWDTPGLGESIEKDKLHIENINQMIVTNKYLIQKIVVVLESNKKDLGSVFKIFEQIIIPNKLEDKVVIILNQADQAMKGKGWNHQLEKPEPSLLKFIEEQKCSITRRIHKSTNIKINDIVSYSAVYSYNLESIFSLLNN